MLLNRDPNIVNATESTGRTALMFAIIVGNQYVVERLLEEQKINIYLKDCNGKTALDYSDEFFERKENRMLVDVALKHYIKNGCQAHNKLFISV